MPAGHLLAKSSRGNTSGRSLVGHTQDVVDAFEALFGKPDHPTAFAVRWARFFRLADLHAFLINGRVAAETHDWGKANSEFQAMLLRKGTQLLRHEQISAVLLHQPDVWEWIGRNRGLDLPVILAAVVGHHLKVKGSEFGCPQADTVAPLKVLWDDEEWQEYLATLVPGSLQAVPAVPKLWSYLPQQGIVDLHRALMCVREELEGLGEDLEEDEPRRRLLWAIRAALIVSDSAGSGLFREDKPLKPWIGAAFDEAKRLDGQSVRRKVIDPRIEQIGDRWAGWNGFQEACGNPEQVPARALLLAPCGSGKTLAAWRWIEARCAENPVSRVIFLYPTRGTATEGYRDYVSHAGPEEVALVHGTADLEIDDIHPDLDAEGRIKDARLFALKQWPKQLFSATADQFLGFLQHGYGSTCLLPLLADSVLVLDEIHSYDRGMFSALLDLLRHFDLPVLCMTATLLKRRQDQLEKGRPDLGGHGLTIVNGLDFGGDAGQLQAIAEHPRYRVQTARDSTEAEHTVRAALADRKRILWVVNTVDRAREIARRFADDPSAAELTVGGIPLFCYHSRFRLGDRKSKHEQVINSFRGGHTGRSPVLAITTQVCEMSLDLDADLLVTEQAPASALVQRFGRCCRDMKAHEAIPARVGDVLIYPPENLAPYEKPEMLGVDEFVRTLLAEGVVSQSRLEELLSVVPHTGELPKDCRFIESGPWAASGEETLRDIDDRNRQALLPTDVDEYLRLSRKAPPWKAQKLIITVPKGYIDPKPHLDLPQWLRLTHGGEYHQTLGYGERDKPPRALIL